MTIDDMILSYRDYFGTYHHHKEQMAYTAATLYLAAATGVVIYGPDVWKWASPCAVTLILLCSAILGFAFVGWQLYYRAFAADIVLACTSIAARLVATPASDQKFTFTPICYHGLMFPKVLVDELKSISFARGVISGPRVAAAITMLAMLAWSVLAYLAISGGR